MLILEQTSTEGTPQAVLGDKNPLASAADMRDWV